MFQYESSLNLPHHWWTQHTRLLLFSVSLMKLDFPLIPSTQLRVPCLLGKAESWKIDPLENPSKLENQILMTFCLKMIEKVDSLSITLWLQLMYFYDLDRKYMDWHFHDDLYEEGVSPWNSNCSGQGHYWFLGPGGGWNWLFPRLLGDVGLPRSPPFIFFLVLQKFWLIWRYWANTRGLSYQAGKLFVTEAMGFDWRYQSRH